MKDQFIVYPFDKQEYIRRGSIRSEQRWEQCVVNLMKYFGPALHGLYKVRHFNKEVQDSVLKLTKDVIEDIITLVNKYHEKAKNVVAQKLNAVKIQIGYPEEINDFQKIEEFYNDLELDETKGVINSFLKVREFYYKIHHNPESSWRRILNDKFGEFEINYDIARNVICKFN